MPNSVIFDLRSEARTEEFFDDFSVSCDELMGLLSQFDPYGLWRVDIETGLVYWSRDVFAIHGMPFKPGPVDLKAAINAYHVDDRDHVGQILEETIANKSAFRFVMRLKRRAGGYKLVKSTGRYRTNSDGRAEIFGTFSEFQPPKRAIGLYEATPEVEPSVKTDGLPLSEAEPELVMQSA